jgi:hypothetical protein
VIVTRVVKLLPTPQEASALEATLRACNQACGLISQAAHAGSVFDRNRLQKLVYRRVREERGLGAQAAVRCVKKTVNAYAALHAQAKAGLLGWEGSTRRMRVLGRRIVFGPLSAQPFDDRMLSWRHDIDRRNRPSQAMFACRSCGVVAHADRNASCVIAQRGENLWTAGRESRVPAPTPQPA